MQLDDKQIESYERDGFVVVRSVLDGDAVDRFKRAFFRNADKLRSTQEFIFPEPGRYELVGNSILDQDLSFIVEHPVIVGCAAELLRDDPILTAFAIYDRTHGGGGMAGHNDYKRWRPVGSSMNWLFAIVPFCDHDEAHGQLFIAPGSHRVERFEHGRVMSVTPPTGPTNSAYVDPDLRQGDLLLMNMHCWHKAGPNKSGEHRIGVFNKYAAKMAPPAAGYYVFSEEFFGGLSERGKRLIAVHSDKSIATTRLLLFQEDKCLLVGHDEKMTLPGGPTWAEEAIPDWDTGNFIEALRESVRKTLKIETPWVSYVGDFAEGDQLCRVYGYDFNSNGYRTPFGGKWADIAEVRRLGSFGYEALAIEKWLERGTVRGKGVTQYQGRIDQFAY